MWLFKKETVEHYHINYKLLLGNRIRISLSTPRLIESRLFWHTLFMPGNNKIIKFTSSIHLQKNCITTMNNSTEHLPNIENTWHHSTRARVHPSNISLEIFALAKAYSTAYNGDLKSRGGPWYAEVTAPTKPEIWFWPTRRSAAAGQFSLGRAASAFFRSRSITHFFSFIIVMWFFFWELLPGHLPGWGESVFTFSREKTNLGEGGTDAVFFQNHHLSFINNSPPD